MYNIAREAVTFQTQNEAVTVSIQNEAILRIIMNYHEHVLQIKNMI